MPDETSPRRIERLLSSWRTSPEIGGSVVCWERVPAHAARTVDYPATLHPALKSALQSLGIPNLYTHQAQCFEAASHGDSLTVVTGTASGKTLCYNLPVLDALLRNRHARALYLFPTKALAQDQKSSLERLVTALQNTSSANVPSTLSPQIYDGDTPNYHRTAIRNQGRIILTNPDMLHTGILPHHTLWETFFQGLSYVVIDEMHTYRGVFGSHVANVIRRMKRVAAFYGASPQFLLTSATIGNPIELAEGLVEEPVVLIDDDGSARGEKHFLIYNPPMVNPDLGIRRSALLESTRLSQEMKDRGIQTIVFARSRRSVEIILAYLRQNRDNTPAEIRGYRSGYLPAERRAIEAGLRSGDVRVVVATNALELGIDIGNMEAAVLVGYPGSISATWQQAGRAGRKNAAALAVLVTSADALDQFLSRHPEYFFDRAPESALINPDNLLILLQHIRCAAFELPFRKGEHFGKLPLDQLNAFLEVLVQAGILHRSEDRYFWMADQYPASQISLRSASAETISLMVESERGWNTIGIVDRASAPWMVHPQAVYLHESQTYIVDDLNLEDGVARMHPAELDYYTEARQQTVITSLGEPRTMHGQGCSRNFGEIKVTTQVVGYKTIRWYTHETGPGGLLDLPPTDLHTTGYWISLEGSTVDQLRAEGLWLNDKNDYGPNWQKQRDLARARDGYTCQNCGLRETDRQLHVHHKIPFRNFTSWEQANQLDNLITLCPTCHKLAEAPVRLRSGLAGVGYALSQLAPLFLMCDREDLGVHTDPLSPLNEGQPAIVLYDTAPAGIGLSAHLFKLHDELIMRACELVESCECSDGCPSCVGPGGEEGSGGKAETLAILHALRPLDAQLPHPEGRVLTG